MNQSPMRFSEKFLSPAFRSPSEDGTFSAAPGIRGKIGLSFLGRECFRSACPDGPGNSDSLIFFRIPSGGRDREPFRFQTAIYRIPFSFCRFRSQRKAMIQIATDRMEPMGAAIPMGKRVSGNRFEAR